MHHGSGRAARFALLLNRLSDDTDEGQPPAICWSTIGAWTYSLGSFGTIQGFSGTPRWIVRIDGAFRGFYVTLAGARSAIERAARAAGHRIAP